MKKLLSLVSLAALISGLSIGSANAQGMFGIGYVEASGGITTQDQLDWGGGTFDMDQGWNAAVSVGTTMWSNWDVEGEFSYDKMEYSCCNPNNTHEYRVMLNATRNFDMGGPITPYIGAGIGGAWVTYENSSSESNGTVAAYQVIAGARWALGDQWSLFGEYRYQANFSDPEDSGLEWEHQGNNFALGVRLNLN